MAESPFIPQDNPYTEHDRGLFRAIALKTNDGEEKDVFCRIGEASVLNFQGVSNYSIIGYQVYYWLEQPEDEADYAAFTLYTEPGSNQDTFYFTAMPQVFSPFLVEGYCIEDFIKNVRRLAPNKRTTRNGAFAKYAEDKDRLIVVPNSSYAVNNVGHQAKFVSPKGLPLIGPSNRLRYQGYVIGSDVSNPTPAPGWVYPDNQFIYTDVAFEHRSQIVEAAQHHFAKEGGVEKAMQLLKLT